MLYIVFTVCVCVCALKDLVFALLIANGQLITVVRLKKCFLHPVDLHMIFNLITASDSFKFAESWTPVCLPKFDSRSVSLRCGHEKYWLFLCLPICAQNANCL